MGRRLTSNSRSGEDPSTPYEFLIYLRENLGVYPEPGGYRKAFMGQLKDEMTLNGWTYQDLMTTVKYLKRNRIRIEKPFGLFFHVKKALEESGKGREYDLVSAVAIALEKETDEVWVRRLSLASGKALERVYENWRSERGDI